MTLNSNIILGLDPGLANAGWGIIELENGEARSLGYGSITTRSGEDFSLRLRKIYDEVIELINKYNPSEISVEKIFFARNTSSAIEVAQARGVLLVASGFAGADVYEYTPLEIKQALVGYGKASKAQVQYMVRQFLNLEKIPSPDHAADALAAALCHSSSRRIRSITG